MAVAVHGEFVHRIILEILENLKAYPMDKFSMYRDGHMDDVCKVEING